MHVVMLVVRELNMLLGGLNLPNLHWYTILHHIECFRAQSQHLADICTSFIPRADLVGRVCEPPCFKAGKLIEAIA